MSEIISFFPCPSSLFMSLSLSLLLFFYCSLIFSLSLSFFLSVFLAHSATAHLHKLFSPQHTYHLSSMWFVRVVCQSWVEVEVEQVPL